MLSRARRRRRAGSGGWDAQAAVLRVAMGAIAPDRLRTRCGACLAAEDPWISTGHASFLGGALPWPCSRRSTREGGLHSARVSSRPQVPLSSCLTTADGVCRGRGKQSIRPSRRGRWHWRWQNYIHRTCTTTTMTQRRWTWGRRALPPQ